MENENSPDFILQAFINNKNMRVTKRKHHVSGATCTKELNGILFKMDSSAENIYIPYAHVKDFAMAVLESYCQFSPEFKDKDVRISVVVSTKELKNGH